MSTDPFAYQEIVQLAYLGNIDEARSHLIQLLPKTQEHDFICNAGINLWQIGEYELAELCYRRALEISEVPAIWFNLTITLDDAHRSEEAKESLKSFIRLVETTDEFLAAMEMLDQNGKAQLVSWARQYAEQHPRSEQVINTPLPHLNVMFFPENRNEPRAKEPNPEIISVFSNRSSATCAFPQSRIHKTIQAKRTLQQWFANHAESILLDGEYCIKPFQLLGPPKPEFLCVEHNGLRYFLQEDGSWEMASLADEIVPYPWHK